MENEEPELQVVYQYDQLIDKRNATISSVDAQSAKYKINYWHISIFMLLMSLSSMTAGCGKDVTNQLSDTYNVKYGWVGKKE